MNFVDKLKSKLDFLKNNRGQVANPVEIAIGIILLVVLVIGVGYKYVKSNASASALNVSSTDPEYGLVQNLPLFVILIAFLGLVGYIYYRGR
jgi:hypothetical protein